MESEEKKVKKENSKTSLKWSCQNLTWDFAENFL